MNSECKKKELNDELASFLELPKNHNAVVYGNNSGVCYV